MRTSGTGKLDFTAFSFLFLRFPYCGWNDDDDDDDDMGDMIRDPSPASASREDNRNRNQVFLGTFVHSKSREELEYLHDTAVCVDAEGKIIAAERCAGLEEAEAVLFPKLGWRKGDVKVIVGGEGDFYFPGFIGTCCAACGPVVVQQMGTGIRAMVS